MSSNSLLYIILISINDTPQASNGAWAVYCVRSFVSNVRIYFLNLCFVLLNLICYHSPDGEYCENNTIFRFSNPYVHKIPLIVPTEVSSTCMLYPIDKVLFIIIYYLRLLAQIKTYICSVGVCVNEVGGVWCSTLGKSPGMAPTLRPAHKGYLGSDLTVTKCHLKRMLLKFKISLDFTKA